MEYTRRLFAGVFVPADAVKILRKRQKQLNKEYSDLPIRWTPLEDLYLPITSLGHVSDSNLPGIIESLTKAVRGCAPFDVVFNRWALGPSEKQPKMVWLATESPSAQLGALRTAVERVMAPLYPDIKEIRPHITLGQVAQKRWRDYVDVPQIERETSIVVPIDAITLFESTTEDGKRIFVPLATCDLEGTD